MKITRLIGLWLTAALLLLVSFMPIGALHAHEIRPALLNITEQKPGWFEVTWKVPVLPGYEVDITPVLPASLAAYGPPASHDLPGAKIQYATYQAKDGTTGR